MVIAGLVLLRAASGNWIHQQGLPLHHGELIFAPDGCKKEKMAVSN